MVSEDSTGAKATLPEGNKQLIKSRSDADYLSLPKDIDNNGKSQIDYLRRASIIAVAHYQSARLGAEIAFGILPEAY